MNRRGEVSFSSFLNVYSTNNPLLYDFSEHKQSTSLVPNIAPHLSMCCSARIIQETKDDLVIHEFPVSPGIIMGRLRRKSAHVQALEGEQVSRARGTSRGNDQRSALSGVTGENPALGRARA